MGALATRPRSTGSSKKPTHYESTQLLSGFEAELAELPYYYPEVDNTEKACNILQGHPEGSFILRKCGRRSNEEVCTVSVVVGASRAISHLRLKCHSGVIYFESEKPFRKPCDLVEFYASRDVPNVENVAHIRLKKPLYRPGHRPPAPPLSSLPAARGEPYQYSYAEPCSVDRSDAIIINLQQHWNDKMRSAGSSKDDKCECGLSRTDASLPGGWTVHRNVPTGTCFYKGPDGLSHWDLPQCIREQLKDSQMEFIAKIVRDLQEKRCKEN